MSVLGGEFKINVHAEPLNGFRMVDYDFECMLYVYKDKGVVYKKGDESLKKTDDDNYRICVTSEDSLKLGRGNLKLRFTAHIPDVDYSDGFRTEIVDDVCVGVSIT